MKPAVLVAALALFAVGYALGYSAWEKTYGDRTFYALKIGGLVALIGTVLGVLVV